MSLRQIVLTTYQHGAISRTEAYHLLIQITVGELNAAKPEGA